MAFVFTDGFDSYAASADLLKKWIVNGNSATWSSSSGRFAGGCLAIAANGGGIFSPITLFGAGLTTGGNQKTGHGFWAKFSAQPSAISSFYYLINSAGVAIPLLRINTSGQLVYCNSGGATLLTSVANYCDNQWHWVEGAFNCQSSSATTWQVDGVNAMSATVTYAINTNVGVGVGFGGNTNGMNVTIDDIIVYDDNGNAPTATAQFPLGPRQITTIRPNADSAVQFSRSSGANNYALVNEVNSDGDSSYVQDNVSGHQDLYDFDDISFVPAAINGVMLNGNLENSYGGTFNYKFIGKSSTTQRDGSSTILPQTYQVQQMEFGVDPATSAAWSQSAINAAKFGIKVP